MMRTSLVLPPVLFQQLEHLAHKRGKSFSVFIREALTHYVRVDSKRGLQATYDALWQMEGTVQSDNTNASTTVDDILYGEKGAWRGSPGKRGVWTLPLETTPNEV